MPQLSPILWNLFPFVMVLFIILVIVSLFYEDEIVVSSGFSFVVEKGIEW